MFSDFHNDYLTSDLFLSSDKKDLPSLYKNNNIITAVYRGKRTFKQALYLASYAKNLAFEDLGYKDFDYNEFRKTKPLYVGLTWNEENVFGYGCNYTNSLKKSGIELIKNLNKDFIAVDCAHISKDGFKDIIEYANIVVNSHTCFSRCFEHKRNMEDWQLKELANRGGLIGLTCCGYFMTNKKHCKISDFIRQIDYFVQKFGVDNISIGTDFYGTDFTVENTFDYEILYGMIKAELIKKGYSHKAIDKILYKNLLFFTNNIRKLQFHIDN